MEVVGASLTELCQFSPFPDRRCYKSTHTRPDKCYIGHIPPWNAWKRISESVSVYLHLRSRSHVKLANKVVCFGSRLWHSRATQVRNHTTLSGPCDYPSTVRMAKNDLSTSTAPWHFPSSWYPNEKVTSRCRLVHDPTTGRASFHGIEHEIEWWKRHIHLDKCYTWPAAVH